MATVIQQPTTNENDVWDSAVNGDTNAFEQVVISHQSAVSAVAFSIVGDFATSQDIAQETFWAAWNSKDSLRDAKRLGAWLCGISRNLARQWNRSKSRRKEVESEKLGSEFDSLTTDPADDFVTKEEESVVWSALENIPENYREVLVLYYRQGKSIEQVAESLDISNDAARQRLSRGREILRSRVSNMIEGVLDRTNPTRTFTARVMAGIVSAGVAGSSASAKASVSMAFNSSTVTSAASVAKILGSGGAIGMLGGLMGAGIGLLGAWFGTWWPAQMAPTETERHLLLERGRTSMNLTVIFAMITIGLVVVAVAVPQVWLPVGIAFLVSNVLFIVAITTYGIETQKLVTALRKEISPEEDPNRSKFGKNIREKSLQQPLKFGRRCTSKISFLGLPLFDIQFSDPPRSTGKNTWSNSKPRTAVGWIAIGDMASGVIAIGGRAFGGIALGGLATGGIAVGGLSCGLLSIGGLALGLFAFGGAAIGYDAAGGGAIGWNSATGGGAAAWHAAMGGGVIAHDFAVGPSAIANEANTDLAKKVIEENCHTWLLNKNSFGIWTFAVIFFGVFGAVAGNLCYTTNPPDDPVKEN